MIGIEEVLKFFKSLGRIKIFYSGGTGYVDVVDVSKSLINLMDSEVINERYIVNSENLLFRTVFDWIAEDLNKPKANIKVTPLLKEIVWRLKVFDVFLLKTPLITKKRLIKPWLKWLTLIKN